MTRDLDLASIYSELASQRHLLEGQRELLEELMALTSDVIPATWRQLFEGIGQRSVRLETNSPASFTELAISPTRHGIYLQLAVNGMYLIWRKNLVFDDFDPDGGHLGG